VVVLMLLLNFFFVWVPKLRQAVMGFGGDKDLVFGGHRVGA
jgi:hypothetical protein